MPSKLVIVPKCKRLQKGALVMKWIKSSAALLAAGLLFVGFLANVVVGKLAILEGATVLPGLGDVGEFVLLLLAVLLFIAGCLQREAAAPSSQKSTGQKPTETSRES